jgi:hypothetical protein
MSSTTVNKDFKVKNGIQVNGGGNFNGPVSVATPTDPSHAVTKEYLDSLIATLGLGELFGGTASTVSWASLIDGGTATV